MLVAINGTGTWSSNGYPDAMKWLTSYSPPLTDVQRTCFGCGNHSRQPSQPTADHRYIEFKRSRRMLRNLEQLELVWKNV
jgi:hypothetical protein